MTVDVDTEAPTLPEPAPRCPKCGAPLLWSYGLAGGGMGPYEFCDNGNCYFFSKLAVYEE